MTVALDSMNDTTHQPLSLYRHSKCDDWGLAILAWERDDRRGYQFEDGKLRIIKQGYYSLLQEVNEQVDGAGELIAQLRRRAGAAAETRSLAPESTTPTQLDEQLVIFRALHTRGFQDEEWLSKIRGREVERRLKRHRDAAIREARTLLSREELDGLLAAQRFDEVFDRMKKVLNNTDLVSSAQLEHLRVMSSQQTEGIALALRALLHGEGHDHAQRFDAFVRALSTVAHGKPSWPLATALPALVHPGQHICVRPSSFTAQARTLAPALRLGKRPSGQHYAHLLQMAQEMAVFVQRAGLTPDDLMDIYDFMWATLRPAARKLLTADAISDTSGDASGVTSGDNDLAQAA